MSGPGQHAQAALQHDQCTSSVCPLVRRIGARRLGGPPSRRAAGYTAPSVASPAGQATTPRRPRPAPLSPVQIANQAERQRIMNLLKISAIPPGAVSSSPATYDEADANPYPNLPIR